MHTSMNHVTSETSSVPVHAPIDQTAHQLLCRLYRTFDHCSAAIMTLSQIASSVDELRFETAVFHQYFIVSEKS